MDFNINIPVKVISGRDCLIKNGDKLAAFGRKCLIVTGGKSAKLSGAIDDLTSVLKAQGIHYDIYDKITANPLLSACHEAGEIARNMDADFIVGIGGGSPLDAAKATAVFAANPQLAPMDVYTVKERNRALPIIAIGTTAGTGSEVGRVSVLTNDATGRKKSISPDDCNPSLTFADPKYTESMPYSVTCSTALDALCHVLEGYFSVKCTDIPTMFGEKAIKLIWHGLKELHRTKTVPTSEIRDELYYGSLYAGITLAYCGTGFPHPLGYVLTENYGVPHGFACSTFLPAFMERASRYEPEKFARVMEIMGEDLAGFSRVVVELTTLPYIVMKESKIDEYCSRWDEVTPANFKFSPGGFTKEEAEELFRELFLK